MAIWQEYSTLRYLSLKQILRFDGKSVRVLEKVMSNTKSCCLGESLKVNISGGFEYCVFATKTWDVVFRGKRGTGAWRSLLYTWPSDATLASCCLREISHS